MKKISILFHNLSLTTKLSVVFAMLIFFGFFGISYFNYENAKKTLHNRIVKQELPLLTENIHSLVQKELESPIAITELNAKNVFIIDWLTKGETENLVLYEYLKEIKGREGIKTINLISDKSKNFYNELGKFRKINEKDPKDSWYFDLKKSSLKKEFNISYSKEGVLSFFINYKIFDKNNNFLGITAVGLPIDDIVNTILSKKIGKKGNIYLINQEGFIKVHQNKNLIYKNKTDSIFKNIKYMPSIKNTANKILKERNIDFSYKKGNETTLVHTKFIPEFNWILIIEFSENEILAPIFKIFINNLITGGIITLVICFFMIIILRILVLSPLKTFEKGLLGFFDFLNRKTDTISKVNLSYKDELGKMANVINENILQIQENIKQDNELITATVKIIETISKGILTPRLDVESQNLILNNLKNEINEMLYIFQYKIGKDINVIIDVMSAYQKMNFDVSVPDAEAEIEQKVNEMGKSILTQNKKIERQNQEILQQKQAVEETNKQMQSSIEAAKTIQRAIFPYQEKMDKLLKNYFVIYTPKDGVSGDFFWLNEVDNKIILAVADCTGHGVPGAFMTLIGSTLLDKIVRVWDIHSPEKILERLHEEVWTVLRQKDTNNENGMDIGILCIEKNQFNEESKITFAGAKNDLFYLKENEDEIQIIKGERRAIGGLQNENIIFQNKEIHLPKNTWIYLGSDGLEDSCNVSRKRFGRKKIINVLENNKNLPAYLQEKALIDELANFSENTSQRDDILFMGIKL